MLELRGARVLMLALLWTLPVGAQTTNEPSSRGEDEASSESAADPSDSPSDEAATTDEPASEPAAPAEPQQPRTLARDQALQTSARAQLSSGPYDFCTRPTYRLWLEDKQALCGSVQELEGACPGLVRACQAPAWEEVEQKRQEAPSWLSIFDVVSGWGTVLFWAAVVLGVAVLVRLFFKQFLVNRRRSEPRVRSVVADTAIAHFEDDPRSASELLAAAQAALERADLRQALHLFYRASIVSLKEAKLITVHRSKTTRDYVGALELPLRDEVAALTHALDRERFSPGVVSPTAAEELGRRARQLHAQLLRAAPLILALFCCSCDGAALPDDPSADQGPRGYGLFEELLTAESTSVTRRLRRVNVVGPETTTVIALGAHLRELEWEVLRDWVLNGGHLVVAAPNDDFAKALGLDIKTEPCEQPVIAPQLRLAPLRDTRAFVSSQGGEALVSCGTRRVTEVFSWGAGWITWTPSPELFQNRTLALADHATLALEMTASSDAVVELIGPWTGSGALHPLESLTAAGLGPWALHLVVLLGVYALARGRRFGAPVDPTTTARRSFSEHADALAAQYARAGASGLALSRYAEWAFETLRRRVASSDDSPQNLGRAAANSDRQLGNLGRTLALSRKASELGENENQHLARFRALEGAIQTTRGRSSIPAAKSDERGRP